MTHWPAPQVRYLPPTATATEHMCTHDHLDVYSIYHVFIITLTAVVWYSYADSLSHLACPQR